MDESFAFERFVLDTGDRRLRLDEEPIELNGRYFDALSLLVREQGRLVSKDRFLEEVWRGVPVTDEALTQCIKTLRRQLGDDAARPRFIETVPKHGYRFIAPVEPVGSARRTNTKVLPDHWQQFVATGLVGTAGGAVAGVIGGLVYGFLGASQAVQSGAGAISILLVLLCITTAIGVIGAAGVSFAIGTAAFAPARSWQWLTVAGAGGGLVTGAVVKLLGIDAFILLIGRAPSDITGAMEGLLLGAAVGAAASLAPRMPSVRRAGVLAAGAGALAGVAIVLLGGRLLLGSLAAVTGGFPNSHLHVDRIGGLFGESQFGPITQLVTAALEGALFVGCVVAALELVRRGRVKA